MGLLVWWWCKEKSGKVAVPHETVLPHVSLKDSLKFHTQMFPDTRASVKIATETTIMEKNMSPVR